MDESRKENNYCLGNPTRGCNGLTNTQVENYCFIIYLSRYNYLQKIVANCQAIGHQEAKGSAFE